MPVYKAEVTIEQSNEPLTVTRLVEAKTEASALKFICQHHITVCRPTSAELVALGADGIQIEQAD